ncbi:MAG: response regulator transcription factor [Longimicrobiales bacterium]|nr:response regulator transcription factor [Longimicrobiales bacterium]
MTEILIIEDNEDLAFGLRKTLEFEGYEVIVAKDGPTGLEEARDGRPDLVLLDVMLPGMDGFQVLEKLRAGGGEMPVLMLTARDQEADVIMGFHSGADDYVTKPFSTLELVARVRALLRRTSSERSERADGGGLEATFGDVTVDEGSRTVAKGGQEVALTPKEFDLLVALLRREGDVASRPELLEEVWEYANSDVMTRTVDIHIAELRRKLEDRPSKPRHILTVRKAGYRLER